VLQYDDVSAELRQPRVKAKPIVNGGDKLDAVFSIAFRLKVAAAKTYPRAVWPGDAVRMRDFSSQANVCAARALDPNAHHRRAELQRLLPLWPSEIADLSLRGRRRVVQFLARALREERRRARGGHWAYDLARHAALARAWRSEREAFNRLQSTRNG
jgi:hypothetical protein